MDNRGYGSSVCFSNSKNYELDGLEDDLEYKWMEMTIERCNSTIKKCAD